MSQKASIRTLLAYGASTAGAEIALFGVLVYYFKFATDVLLVSPMWVGIAFGAARVWDAVSDPLVGDLSDRTQSRWGPRRPWILGGAIGLTLAPLLLWAPPALGETAMRVWVTVACIVFFTVHTAVAVPLASLGSELGKGSDARTRAFGAEQLGHLVGMLIGMAGVAVLIEAAMPRTLAVGAAVAFGASSFLLIAASLPALATPRAAPVRERTWASLKHVAGNPYARTLAVVHLASTMATAALTVLGGHLSEQIIGDASAMPWLIGVFVLSSALFVPVARLLARRWSKRSIWIGAMAVSIGGFLGLGLAPRGALAWALLCAAITGAAETCSSVVGGSMQSEVVDQDELVTGERRASTYFAVWAFLRKAAHALALLGTGAALEAAGYDASEPSEEVIAMLRFLLVVVPAAGYLVAIAALSRHRLDEAAHAQILAQLDARAVPPLDRAATSMGRARRSC